MSGLYLPPPFPCKRASN